jgi:hypothetical protein
LNLIGFNAKFSFPSNNSQKLIRKTEKVLITVKDIEKTKNEINDKNDINSCFNNHVKQDIFKSMPFGFNNLEDHQNNFKENENIIKFISQTLTPCENNTNDLNLNINVQNEQKSNVSEGSISADIKLRNEDLRNKLSNSCKEPKGISSKRIIKKNEDSFGEKILFN